jgi:phage tail-like protein
MSNQIDTSQILTGFYFSLEFVGLERDVAFQEVSGFSKELTTEDVVCGGENSFKYRLPTITTFQNLVLKRGVTLKDSPLLKWCSDTLDNGLALPIVTRNIIVNLLNEQGQSCKSWTFINAYPVKWAASELNSEKNAVFIETIELAYQAFEISTN